MVLEDIYIYIFFLTLCLNLNDMKRCQVGSGFVKNKSNQTDYVPGRAGLSCLKHIVRCTFWVVLVCTPEYARVAFTPLFYSGNLLTNYMNSNSLVS